MAKKINPLNSKVYRAVTTMLTVTDVKAAAAFYQKAFGFTKAVMMQGPDGKPMHAELRLRDSVVMLGPESPERGARSAKTIGASPASLYVMVENADKAFAKAVKAGAKPAMPVTEMFWGDRCGTLIDPEGYTWMVSTHVAEPTPKEMKLALAKQMAQMSAATA